jgi:hypothetical protein
MNNIQDNTAKPQTLTLYGDRNCFDLKPKCHDKQFQGDGNKFELPFMNDGCSNKSPSQDGLINIVEQFTSLLQGVFSVLEQTIQGLFSMLSKEQPAAETPAAPTPAAPAPTPTPQAPAQTTPAPAETPAAKAPKNSEKPSEKDKSGEIAKNGEFLWKPVSEKDGKLAIVLPGNLTGKVKTVKIVDANGKVLAKGDYSGTGNPLKNGDREHYRFGREGKAFPDGSFVQITLNNGNVKMVKIKNTSERFIR